MNPRPSRVSSFLISRWDNNRPTCWSESLPPSMRVEEPMLAMVATRRKADNRSGANIPSALHAPLNSSISAMSASISGVILRVSVRKLIAISIPINTHRIAQKHPQLADPANHQAHLAPFFARKGNRHPKRGRLACRLGDQVIHVSSFARPGRQSPESRSQMPAQKRVFACLQPLESRNAACLDRPGQAPPSHSARGKPERFSSRGSPPRFFRFSKN